MGVKIHSLILALVAISTNGETDIWGTADEATEIHGAEQLEDCVTNSMAGKCVTSRLLCRTRHDGRDFVTWRSTDTPCKTGVCCKLADVIDANTTSGPATPPSSGGGLPEASAGCGIRNKEGVFQKAAGDVVRARFGEFPWTVAIYSVDKNGKQKYECVGSLIHPQVVLTVANRFDRGGDFTVRAGDWYLPTEDEVLERVDRRVKSFVIHESFNSGFGTNDIALLFLDGEIKKDDHINYMCLPNTNQATPATTTCLASGWGRSTIDGELQDTQKMVTLQVVDHDTCQSQLRSRSKKYKLPSSSMCAVGNGQDTCKGDGGAPLVCPYPGQDDRYYQAGITSWGFTCQSKSQPGVYTDVANLRGWIDEKMAANNFSTQYYTPA